ncbi:hypothetical protein D3C80_1162330 [compost metagenome]
MNVLRQADQPVIEQRAEEQQPVHLHLVCQRQHRLVIVFRGDIEQQRHITAALQLPGHFIQQRKDMRVFQFVRHQPDDASTLFRQAARQQIRAITQFTRCGLNPLHGLR